MNFDIRNLRRMLAELPDEELEEIVRRAAPLHGEAIHALVQCQDGDMAAASLNLSYGGFRDRLHKWGKQNDGLVAVLASDARVVWIYPQNGRTSSGIDGATRIYESYFRTKPDQTAGWSPPGSITKSWAREWNSYQNVPYSQDYSGPFLISIEAAGDSIGIVNGYVRRDNRGWTYVAIWFLIANPTSAVYSGLPIGKMLADQIRVALPQNNVVVFFELGLDQRILGKTKLFRRLLPGFIVGLPVFAPRFNEEDRVVVAPYFQPPLKSIPQLEPFALGIAVSAGSNFRVTDFNREMYSRLVDQIYEIYVRDTSADRHGIDRAKKEVFDQLGDARVVFCTSNSAMPSASEVNGQRSLFDD